MADKQYGLSPKEIEILRDQAARRAVNRESFLKQLYNPHKSGECGYVFDPAVQRYMSMNVTRLQYFRPSPKTSIYGLLLSVIPISLYGYAMWRERNNREQLYRTGQVAYRDRGFKFV